VKTKLLLLNVTANTGSTGRIAEEIGLLAEQSGFEVRFAYGRKAVNSQLRLIKIGNKWDIRWHGVKSRLWDAHGFGSRHATKALIEELKVWKPDIVNIHNLHGYYVNVEILFEYLKRVQIPVVWTFHDCWPFTGHCSFFERVSCEKYKTQCNQCPLSKYYPESWFLDNSRDNFRKKAKLFNGLDKLQIVTPSRWLANLVNQSFLKNYPVNIIHNGIDLNVFKPTENKTILKKYNLEPLSYILGVASIWDRRKGLDDFLSLGTLISDNQKIVLVGLSGKQLKSLPENIIGIARTENLDELVQLYSNALVFVNPTYVDNFPTTNLEALACSTPVVTYRTGGSPEAVNSNTGFILEKGDIRSIVQKITEIKTIDINTQKKYCRNRAELMFNKNDRFFDYIKLFKRIPNSI